MKNILPAASTMPFLAMLFALVLLFISPVKGVDDTSSAFTTSSYFGQYGATDVSYYNESNPDKCVCKNTLNDFYLSYATQHCNFGNPANGCGAFKGCGCASSCDYCGSSCACNCDWTPGFLFACTDPYPTTSTPYSSGGKY